MIDCEYRDLKKSVWMRNGAIQYIDESQLPCNIKINIVKTLSDAQKAISGLKIRAFGQVLLILYMIIDKINQNNGIAKEQLYLCIRKIEKSLSKIRPTFPFGDIVKPYLAFLDQEVFSSEIGIRLKNKILEDLEILRVKRIHRAQWVSELLHDKDCVLTHCNTSGDMVMLADVCKKAGKSISFYVTETRPHLQGSRLTAWELANADIPVTIISDSAVARTISEGRVQAAITGADRCALNGDIINKVGTFQLAVVCKAQGIPFYVMAQAPSKVGSGQEITIEYRKGQEILNFPKPRNVANRVNTLFPCFDITPSEYIDRIINFEGIEYPNELKMTLPKEQTTWI
jgi:methylthioribose-1-phosphate isomerase